MSYTVGRVAALAHVSVRTLHHYDAIGLLRPSGRSATGYRLYGETDLERLQQILFYRELGVSLDEIARIVNDPGFDRLEALAAQRALVLARLRRDEALLDLLDRTIHAGKGDTSMTKEEMFEVFGEADPSQYEDEVRERWGDTDAYKESSRRTARYTKADWEGIRDEGAANLAAMVALFDAGVPPEDVRAMDVAEAARLQIDRAFYPCSREMHVGLAEMYVADPRFTAYYDAHREGLARWFHDAIVANAARPPLSATTA